MGPGRSGRPHPEHKIIIKNINIKTVSCFILIPPMLRNENFKTISSIATNSCRKRDGMQADIEIIKKKSAVSG